MAETAVDQPSDQQVEEAQADGDHDLVEEAVLYLTEKRYPNNVDNSRKRQIRKKAEKFVVKDSGELYYNPGCGKPLVKYIQTRVEQQRIVKCAHSDPTSGHLGVRKCVARIKERFTWKGIWNDVKTMVAACDECQKVNRNPLVTVPDLNPIPVHHPWHHVGIDFIGPITPVSRNGHRFILTLSDYFTKWVEAVPLPSKCSEGVAKSLFKIFMRMGLPKIVTSDQGGEFRSELERKIMDLLKIKRHYITPYHPQANGLDERWNQTLKQMLVKFTAEKKEQWDDYIDSCVFAYNTSKHESTLYTPFELMFGRRAILPMELDHEAHSGEELLAEFRSPEHRNDDVTLLTTTRKELLTTAKGNIKTAQQRQKEQYDIKHSRSARFGVGSKVLKKDFTRKKRKGGGMDYRWLGPFVITKDLSKGFYSLRCIESGKEVKKINGAHIKAYISEQLSQPSSSSVPPTSIQSSPVSQLLSPVPPTSVQPSPVFQPSSPAVPSTSVQLSPVSQPSSPVPLPASESSPLCQSSGTSPSAKKRRVESFNPVPIAIQMQALPREELVTMLSRTVLSLNDAHNASYLPITLEDYLKLSSRSRGLLKYRSNCIRCLTDDQTNGMIEYLESLYTSAKQDKTQFFSFILDVIVPGALKHIIKTKFSVTTEQADEIMFTIPILREADDDDILPIAKPTFSNELYDRTRKSLAKPKMNTTTSTAAKSSSIQPAICKPHARPVLSAAAMRDKQRRMERREKHRKLDKEGDRVELIDLTQCSAEEEKVCSTLWVEIEDIKLRQSDKECIATAWLTDEIIAAVSLILKRMHPAMGGLQSPLLGETLSFDVCKGEFVQILNVAKNHWITIYSKGCDQVYVYDSLPAQTLTHRTLEQIAAICCSNRPAIDITICNVQVQTGGKDCGLFVLAFAKSLCSGKDPTRITYVQHRLRQHLIGCIEKSNITAFPTQSRPKQKKPPRKALKLEIFCHCRQPHFSDTVDKSLQCDRMIQCDSCSEWFHSSCENVPNTTWANKDSDWCCKNCVAS